MNDRLTNDPSPTRTIKCPTCRKPVAEDAATFPFCSDRCKTIDLGKWLDESYRVSRPIEQADLDQDD